MLLFKLRKGLFCVQENLYVFISIRKNRFIQFGKRTFVDTTIFLRKKCKFLSQDWFFTIVLRRFQMRFIKMTSEI